MTNTINIHKGVGELLFGMTLDEVSALMGKASEVETLDNAADEKTVVARYLDHGLTLFFEGENSTLACIDTNNSHLELWGKTVFDMGEKELVRLMVANNYCQQDIENEDWGERRVSFPEGNIDFYFEDDQLLSITLGS